MPPEQPFELTIVARDAHGEHRAEIEARLPADNPKQAVSKIVEAAMERFGASKFRDAEATR